MYKLKKISLAIALTTSSIVVFLGFPGIASTFDKTNNIEQYLHENPQINVVDDAVYNSDKLFFVGQNGEITKILDNDNLNTNNTESKNADCVYRNAAFIAPSGWQESVDGCGIWGFDNTSKWGYAWSQDPFAWNSGPSCVQGRGYSTNPAISTPAWYNAGCGSSGGATAHIGNRVTVAKIRGNAMILGKVGYVRWR